MGDNTDIKTLLGRRIKELRKKKGFTQEQFAEMVGVCERNISKIECGRNFVTAERLSKIMEILGVEAQELFNFKHVEDTDILKKEIITALQNETVDISLMYRFYTSIK